MNKKSMGKKKTVFVLAIVIVGAIFLGLVLVNKGDGPVNGMMLADRLVDNTQAYSDAAETHSDGIYLVVSNVFNKFQEDYKANIPEGKDLYTVVRFVECPKGSVYNGKWIKDGNIVGEEKRTLSTEPKGVISYMLDGGSAVKGCYTFELYDENRMIFEYTFSID